MIYTCKPEKVSIYVNIGKKTAAQIKEETGCTALINGGLFNMTTFKPVCHLKVDGNVLAKDQYKYWGFAWNDAPVIDMVQDYGNYRNYICCVALVRNGQPERLVYSNELSGYRPRTAFGVFEDGNVWLYADANTKKTPEQLQRLAISQGVKHAIMLDGGGSTQGICPKSTAKSNRIVHNYICVWEGEDEMAIKIGHASLDENRKANGGAAGDQTGSEVCVRNWYNAKWDVVLRPKNADLAEKSARACEAACANNKIGYDQYSRNTLYRYAKLVNFNISKITDECECDCSSLMHVCAIAGGANLPYGANALVTWNMANAFIETGQYEKLTDTKYLVSDLYLKRGDILVRESGHTAMALENGAKAVESSELNTSNVNTITVSLPLLKFGVESNSVKSLQILLNGFGYDCGEADGEFGTKTRDAVRKFQRAKKLTIDGEVGANTWRELLN